MVVPLEHRQRIARLTPLDDVMKWIAKSVHPVIPRDMEAVAALGATLAQDVAVADLHPALPLALIDGWAVRAEATADAGAYAPVILPDPCEVAVGEALRDEGNAVAPLDSVVWRGGKGEMHAALNPGEGVLMPGTDAGVGEVVRQTGHRLRAIDIAVMQALGIDGARVRRPRIRVVCAGSDRNIIVDAIANWIGSAIAADGGEPIPVTPGAKADALLSDHGMDAVVMIGGTGAGAHDDSVHALRRVGVVAAHGIAVSPGETSALGIAESRPVLLIPGRLDAAVAVWLLIGRAMLMKLRGGRENSRWYNSSLIGKAASTIGLTEPVLVRRVADGVEPIASKYLPLATLAHADGWIVIPAASEGLAPGARVTVRPLP